MKYILKRIKSALKRNSVRLQYIYFLIISNPSRFGVCQI